MSERWPPVEVAPDETRCTATTWRGMSHRPYGPGGYNRCARVAGHDGDHVDQWGNVRSDAWVRRHEDAATRSMAALGQASAEAAQAADAMADAIRTPARCNLDAYCFRPLGHFGGCTPSPTPVRRDDQREASANHNVAPVGAALAEQLETSLRAAGFDVTVTYEGGVSTIRGWPTHRHPASGADEERSGGA